jgi:hypothetical protein
VCHITIYVIPGIELDAQAEWSGIFLADIDNEALEKLHSSVKTASIFVRTAVYMWT